VRRLGGLAGHTEQCVQLFGVGSGERALDLVHPGGGVAQASACGLAGGLDALELGSHLSQALADHLADVGHGRVEARELTGDACEREADTSRHERETADEAPGARADTFRSAAHFVELAD